MTAPSSRATPLAAVHQSATPWIVTLTAEQLLPLAAMPARRWLLVQRGRLWVTAATGAPGPAAREADIWLAEGDSLPLPPGSSWLVQAGPGADLMLVEQAPVLQPPDAGTWLHRLLSGLRPRLQSWSHRRHVHGAAMRC